MAWPSKNPDDYMGRTAWGGSNPAAPPVRFGVTVLLVVLAACGALAVLTAHAAWLMIGCSFSPAAVQIAWWVKRRRHEHAAA
jgi:hypothetical protein